MVNTNTTILIVDDEINNITLLRGDLEDAGYKNFLIARNGKEALDILQERSKEIDVVLLDRMMPEMDGVELLEKTRQQKDIRNIPMIMQTAAASKEQVVEGIKAGAYYYLTKPYDDKTMLAIVAAALRDYNTYKSIRDDIAKFKPKLNLIKDSNFIIKTQEDARYLITFLAGYFPEPDRVIFGLSEMFINAIEHGNLGITYEEKKSLISKDILPDEVKRRQQLPENKDKYVQVYYCHDSEKNKITLNIKDQGSGFEWNKYMEIDPDRATDTSGRGIAMARRISFDEVEYIGNGNEVRCTVYIK